MPVATACSVMMGCRHSTQTQSNILISDDVVIPLQFPSHYHQLGVRHHQANRCHRLLLFIMPHRRMGWARGEDCSGAGSAWRGPWLFAPVEIHHTLHHQLKTVFPRHSKAQWRATIRSLMGLPSCVPYMMLLASAALNFHQENAS